MRILLVSFLLAVLSACATVGKPISDEDVRSIKVGETTASVLYARFGKPLYTSRSSDGSQVLSWGYAHINPYAGKNINKSLAVIMSDDDTVSSFTVTDMGTP